MDKLGIFLSVSLYFVVATLIEFAFVLLIKIYNEKSYRKRVCKNRLQPLGFHESSDEIDIEKWSKMVSTQNIMDLNKPKQDNRKKVSLDLSIPKIDKYASFIFISGYIFFNIIYWNL